jgi:hypothetical protein
MLAGCLGSASVMVSGVVDRTVPGGGVLSLVYLGGGGWVMSQGDQVLLTGPLFSNPRAGEATFGSIRSDSSLVDTYLSRYDVSRAEVVLVGHGHYDHVLPEPGSWPAAPSRTCSGPGRGSRAASTLWKRPRETWTVWGRG